MTAESSPGVTQASTPNDAGTRLRHLALHDSLTGLPNRQLLVDRLEQAVAALERSSGVVGVLFIDLDGFKPVNDAFGHDGGDALLVAVARRLERICRLTDTVARLGGDEFVVVCTAGSTNEVMVLADRLVEAVAIPVDLAEGRAEVTASIGVRVITGSEASEPARTLDEADTAMYHAKRRGRGRSSLFDDNLAESTRVRVHVAQRLREELAHAAIVVGYRPVVELLTGRVVGWEVTPAWNGPEDIGLVAEIAEESGLAVPFGRAVIDRLERDTQQWLWESVRPRMLQLQLSYRHLLTDSTIVERLGALVDNGRTGGWSITVELPTVGVGQLGALGDELRELSRRGIYLSARGFTAISALSEAALPLEVMGIDEQFVGDVSTDRQRSAMLTSLLQFATTTGLHVTAAGAQSVTDLRALVAAGCRVSSGPVFGEPVAASELSRIMRRGFRHLTESVARPDRRAELPNRQTRGQDHGHHWILNELAYQFGAEATP